MIGKRLKLARLSLGLSLDELENRIDQLVSAQILAQYERDELMPNSQIFMALADALGVTENFLVSQSDIQLKGVVFHKHNTLTKKVEILIESLVLDFIERYLEIEEALNIASQYWEMPRYCPFPIRELFNADLTAYTMRDYWQISMNTLPHLAEFFEERGIKVLSLSLPEGVSGLTCWVNRQNNQPVPVIVINESHSGEWQRLALSHELGHLVQKVENNVDDEEAANRFAGAFLMPVEMLWETIGTHRRTLTMGELFELKALFGVSIQMITSRCHALGIINEVTYQQLFEQFKQRGWLTQSYHEPQPCLPEKSDRFKRLCFWALAEEIISEPKAAELLGISIRQLNQVVAGIQV